MFKFNGMPYKRSGRAGGKSVSMIGMLVLLLAALLVLPSCDDETETVEGSAGTMYYVTVWKLLTAIALTTKKSDDDYLDATGGTE